MEFDLKQIEGFDWDLGNKDKNERSHRVFFWECEQVFFREPLIIVEDAKHSQSETRFAAFGRADNDRQLVIVFTVRKKLVRVISARDMNRKERSYYEKQSKKEVTQV